MPTGPNDHGDPGSSPSATTGGPPETTTGSDASPAVAAGQRAPVQADPEVAPPGARATQEPAEGSRQTVDQPGADTADDEPA